VNSRVSLIIPVRVPAVLLGKLAELYPNTCGEHPDALLLYVLRRHANRFGRILRKEVERDAARRFAAAKLDNFRSLAAHASGLGGTARPLVRAATKRGSRK